MLLAPFRLARRLGPWLLVAGLVAGAALPGLADLMRPTIGPFAAILLVLAAYRIGPGTALGQLRRFAFGVVMVPLFQVVLPLALGALVLLLGLGAAPLAVALVLMAAAPAISGGPQLSVMTGHDPVPALLMLLLGTAALPLTVLPVLALLPALGSAQEVIAAALRLLAVVVVSGAVGFAIHAAQRGPSADWVRASDGLSALCMGAMVVGLMSAVGPALRHDPGMLLLWLGAACAACFGLQLLALGLLGRGALAPMRVPLAITAGNRNMALFLIALPAHVTDPLLVFIGCYQIPMYLTPLVLGRIYRRA